MWQLLKTEELRSLLKREIENFEIWGRRIIEEELVPIEIRQEVRCRFCVA